MRKADLFLSFICMAGSSFLGTSTFAEQPGLPISAPRPRETTVPNRTTTDIGTPSESASFDNAADPSPKVVAPPAPLGLRGPAKSATPTKNATRKTSPYEESPALSSPPPRPMPPSQPGAGRPSPRRVSGISGNRMVNPNIRRRAFDSETYLRQREMLRARARTARIEERARRGISLSRPDYGSGPSSADLNAGAFHDLP